MSEYIIMADNEKDIENTEQDAENTTEEEEKVNDSKTDAKAKKTKGKTSPKEDDKERDSSEDEEQFGLFDKPLVIEGKRERKKTEFLVKDKQEVKKPMPLVFNGKGDALGSMDVVNHELSRCTALELKPLHKLLFGRDGRASEIKRNIRLFNGFNIEKDTKEYENKKFGLERFTNDGLKRLLEILDLEKKGTRGDLKERIFEFLLKPKETGRSLKAIQKKSETKTKSKSKAKGKSGKRKQPTAKKPRKTKDNEVEEDDQSDEDEKDGEEEQPKKKKAKVSETPAKTKSSPSKSKPKTPSKKEVKKEPPKESKGKKSPKKAAPVTVKITPGKRTSKKTAPKVEKQVEDESSSDDEPLAKKIKKQEPTNEELAQTVRDLLKDADLDQVTVKSISKQVFEKFPDFDLSSKKGFIKETVYSVISGEAD